MACCKNKVCCKAAVWSDEKVAIVKDSAASFGLDASWIADVLDKFGPDALSLVVEALRQGLSKEFVLEAFVKLGPAALSLIVAILNHINSKGLVDSQVSLDSSVWIAILEKYLPDILTKILPILIQSNSDQIVQAIVKSVLDLLNKK